MSRDPKTQADGTAVAPRPHVLRLLAVLDVRVKHTCARPAAFGGQAPARAQRVADKALWVDAKFPGAHTLPGGCSRLVLTALSRAAPPHVVRQAGCKVVPGKTRCYTAFRPPRPQMLGLKRHWVRLLFHIHQMKLLAGSSGAVFRGYAAHLEPGGKAYERHLKQEIDKYRRVHEETSEDTNEPNSPLIEPAPASWLDMQGRAATRIRAATGDDMYGHVLSRLRAREGVRMLSLGSGPGGVELQFARKAPSTKIVCIDLNAGLLEKGRAQSASEGLAVEFRQGDLNTIQLPPEAFDLVFCHASLHHLLELEHIFQQIKRTLKPRGELIAIDVITRHGYRMWPETRKVIDKIWKTLPAAYRVNHTSYHVKMVDEKIVDADARRSDMECIRSEDILPLIEDGFETIAYVPYYSLCRRLFDTMYGPNYDLGRALDRAILDWLWEFDCHYLDTGVLRPETFFGIYRPRH